MLENHILFRSLAQKPSGGSKIKSVVNYSHFETLLKPIPPEVQHEITSIFDGLEKQYAKRAHKKLAAPGEDEDPEDLDEESEEEEEDTDSDRLIQTLKAEQELCDFTGKVVLAILAGAIDVEGALMGKLKTRVQRNRLKLGNNFKEVINYLDEPKPKRSRTKPQPLISRGKQKSKEVVENDEDEDDVLEKELEEGTVEDLRRRELLDEEPEGSADGDGAAADADGDNEIMGD